MISHVLSLLVFWFWVCTLARRSLAFDMSLPKVSFLWENNKKIRFSRVSLVSALSFRDPGRPLSSYSLPLPLSPALVSRSSPLPHRPTHQNHKTIYNPFRFRPKKQLKQLTPSGFSRGKHEVFITCRAHRACEKPSCEKPSRNAVIMDRDVAFRASDRNARIQRASDRIIRGQRTIYVIDDTNKENKNTNNHVDDLHAEDEEEESSEWLRRYSAMTRLHSA